MSDERDLTQDDVRKEHLASVDQRVQALYITGVIGIGLVLMIVLIALMGAASG